MTCTPPHDPHRERTPSVGGKGKRKENPGRKLEEGEYSVQAVRYTICEWEM